MIALGSCTSVPKTGTEVQPPAAVFVAGQLEKAREVLAGGNDQEITEFFRFLAPGQVPQELEARELFILGRAYFHTARNEIELSRGGRHAGMGSLPQRSVDMLITSRDNLLAAVDRQPGGEFAQEAYYLAGRAMDYGFLQDFEQAMEAYRWAAEAYPESEFGIKAARRYQELLDKFYGSEKPSHGN